MWDNHKALQALASTLFFVSFLLCLVSAGWWVAHSDYFPVRRIAIQGSLRHVTQEQLRLVGETELQGTFFTLNIDTIRAAFEKLPWVRQVTVRRVWPDELQINIEEYVALARWGETGLLSTQGMWFDAAADSRLPMVLGPAGSERELAQRLLEFRQLLDPTGLKLAQLHVSERRAWTVTLDNGLVLELGSQALRERLQRFTANWRSTLAKVPYRISNVDLRYPNGFAVRMPEYSPGKLGKRPKKAA